MLQALLSACEGKKVLFVTRNAVEADDLAKRAYRMMDHNVPVCRKDYIEMRGGGYVQFRSMREPWILYSDSQACDTVIDDDIQEC